MNWLFKKLGYRDREYRGDDFRVRIEPVAREAVHVIHTREGKSLNLDGQLIGRKWEGVEVHFPPEIEAARVSQAVDDLQVAFQAMNYGYMIGRLNEAEVVPEAERQAAISELRQMGYELEISADRKQIRQKWIEGAPKPSLEELRKTAPRVMALLLTVHGTRRPLEVLAKSQEF